MSPTLIKIIRFLDFKKVSKNEKETFLSFFVLADEKQLQLTLSFITKKSDGIEILLENARTKQKAFSDEDPQAWDMIMQNQAKIISANVINS